MAPRPPAHRLAAVAEDSASNLDDEDNHKPAPLSKALRRKLGLTKTLEDQVASSRAQLKVERRRQQETEAELEIERRRRQEAEESRRQTEDKLHDAHEQLRQALARPAGSSASEMSWQGGDAPVKCPECSTELLLTIAPAGSAPEGMKCPNCDKPLLLTKAAAHGEVEQGGE
ncbi:hypothetical protein ABPG75_005508 [Micractinium tetrahymenae]